jgi:hypothetical protein
MPPNYAAMAARRSEVELQRVDALILLVSDGAEDELDDLRAMAGDEDEGMENYAEESYEVDAVSALFSQLSAVALYSVVEIRTKSALGTRLSADEIRAAYKFHQLKGLFRKATGRDLASMPEYASVDELRCLNNSYKHSGNVNEELAAFPGWQLDMPLGDVRPAIARLRPKMPLYLAAVTNALSPSRAV